MEPTIDWDSLGVRRAEFRIQTGLVFPEVLALWKRRLRRLPLALFTLESCLDRGDSGMLLVYVRACP